jgi:F0F1-type ATP synthase membrane subunit c/vacuolar-type H+-ATPase subunit K
MKEIQMARTGLLILAALIVGGAGIHQAYAQSGNTTGQKSEKADKQKSTEKKTTTKQSGSQTSGGQSAAPMSGYRPDPQSNY